MAKKPFYSIEEVCAKLGKTEDQIKSQVRAGELRGRHPDERQDL